MMIERLHNDQSHRIFGISFNKGDADNAFKFRHPCYYFTSFVSFKVEVSLSYHYRIERTHAFVLHVLDIRVTAAL